MYRIFFFFIEIIIFLDWSLTQKGAYVVRFFIVTALIVRRLFDNSSLCKVIMPIGIPFYVRVNWLFKVYCADWDEKFLFYTENRFMTQEVRSDFIILQKIYLLWLLLTIFNPVLFEFVSSFCFSSQIETMHSIPYATNRVANGENWMKRRCCIS